MKKISIIALLIAALFAPTVSAQKIYKGEIATSSELRQIDEVMYIDIQMDLSNLKLGKNRYMVLTPIISNQDESEEIYLSPVVINGKNRHKLYKREMAVSKQKPSQDYFTIISTKQKNEPLKYVDTTPFEDWMKNPKLRIEEFVCGCGGVPEELLTDYLDPSIRLVKEVEPPKPIQVVEIKEHIEEVDAFVEYPINQSVILNDFGNNHNILQQLRTGLDKIFSNDNLDISQVEIRGYASPEGPSALNQKLSVARADAMKEYLLKNFPDINSNIIKVTYGGEDWKKLEELIEKSNYAEKDQILSIIRNTENVDLRKSKLKTLNSGSAHRKMAKEVYPQIRRATFYIYYTVKEKEIREVFETP